MGPPEQRLYLLVRNIFNFMFYSNCLDQAWVSAKQINTARRNHLAADGGELKRFGGSNVDSMRQNATCTGASIIREGKYRNHGSFRAAEGLFFEPSLLLLDEPSNHSQCGCLPLNTSLNPCS